MPDISPSPELLAFVEDNSSGGGAAQVASPELQNFVQDEIKAEKYGSAGQQAIAGIEGLARGASFGLSDVAETKLLKVNPEDIQARREANPWTSGVGQFGGAVGMTVATGGLAAPLEGAIGTGVLARAAATGIEGAAFGAGNALSDAVLGNADLTAEKVLTDMGIGAAFGAGLGALSKGVEHVLPKGAEKLRSSLGKLKESALGTVESPGFAVEAMSIPGSLSSGESRASWTKSFFNGMKNQDPEVSSRALSKNLQEIFDSSKTAAKELYETAVPANVSKALETMPLEDARRVGTDVITKIDDLVNRPMPGLKENLARELEEVSKNSKAVKLRGQLDDLKVQKEWIESEQARWAKNRPVGSPERLEANENLGKLLKQETKLKAQLLEAEEGAAQKAAEIQARLDKAENKINLSFDEKESTLSGANGKILNERLSKLESDLNKAKSSDEIFRSLDDFAKDIDRKKLIKFDKLPTASQMGDQEILHGVRNAVRGSLGDEGAWGQAASHYNQVTSDYSSYRTALKNFQSTFMKREAGPSGAPRYIVDPSKVKTFFSKYGDISQDLRAQYLDDFVNSAENLSKASENYHGFVDSGESISKKVSELAKKNKELSQMAEVMAGRSAPEGSSMGAPAAAALGYGAHALGVPNPVIGTVIGAAALHKGMKNPYQLGSTLANTFEKLQALSEISASVGKRLESAVKGIFASDPSRTVFNVIPSIASSDDFEKRTKRLAQLSKSDGMLLMDHLAKTTQGIQAAAPNVTQSLQIKMVNAVQFLESKRPKPAQYFPLSDDWQPSNAQKDKFNEYYKAVNDPLSALKAVKTGTLTNEAMEAIQTVHPELLQEMRGAIISSMDPKKFKNLSYPTKISLSLFMGQPLDQSLTPESILANQISLNSQNRGTQTSPKLPRTTLGGLKELSFANRADSKGRGNRDDQE